MRPIKMINKLKYLLKFQKSITAFVLLLLVILVAQFYGVFRTNYSLAALQNQAPNLELKFTVLSSSQVQLDWRMVNAKANTPFLIYRSATSENDFVYIGSVPSSGVASLFLDRNL